MDCLKHENKAAIQDTLSYCRPIMEQMVSQLDSSEITITFKQTWRDTMDNEDIMRMMKKYFNSIPLNDLRELILVPEYGESLNLHYHGVIRGKLKDVSSLKTFLNRKFGRTEIKNIKYPDSYVKYMLKEQDETDIEDIIYIKYNDTQKEPRKITVKKAPIKWEHPMNSREILPEYGLTTYNKLYKRSSSL